MRDRGNRQNHSQLAARQLQDAAGVGAWLRQMHVLDHFDTPYVFAGLLTVILIGLAVESLIFRTLEERTVRKWDMQR